MKIFVADCRLIFRPAKKGFSPQPYTGLENLGQVLL
jgi:hypothetical protein